MKKNSSKTRYQPEWFGIGNASVVDDGHSNPATFPQSTHTISTYGLNKINPVSQERWFWALKAEDPTHAEASQVHPASLGSQACNLAFYPECPLDPAGFRLPGPASPESTTCPSPP